MVNSTRTLITREPSVDSEAIKQRVRCGSCQASLVSSRYVNMVAVNRRAEWQNPVTGNVMTGHGPQAVGFLCDGCLRSGQLREVVEFAGEETRYHELESLEELPPEPTAIVFAAHGRPAITCLRCNLTSWNENDVEQRYCGNCREFHAEVHSRGAEVL